MTGEARDARMGVAVVNYNTRDHLHACLASVTAAGAREVVVVDNGSTDGSAEMVRRDFAGVLLHVDHSNPGYGAGANRAIALCASPYVLLLNSDTLLRPGALAALARYLDEHPRAGVVGPRLVNLDGSLQPSCRAFPSPLVPLHRQESLGRVARHLPLLGDRYLAAWPHTHARVVPWVVGAALALRREAMDAVGGFDESFFMYSEEIDLSYRMRRHGWETHFAPVTDVVHAGGASTKQYHAAMSAQLFLSSLHFYERHFSGARLAQAVFMTRLSILARLVRDRVRLRAARDAATRERLAENLSVWRRVLLDSGPRRRPAAARGG